MLRLRRDAVSSKSSRRKGRPDERTTENGLRHRELRVSQLNAKTVAYGSGGASLALVLPTLREAETIEAVIRRVIAALDPMGIVYQIIVVDDDSQDDTGDIVRRLAFIFPQIRLIERYRERGLSGAILDGWASSSAAVFGVIDADLQHPPELLPHLWASMEDGADIAIASRFARGANIGRFRWFRRQASALTILLCKPLQNGQSRVGDPMSGFFMVKRQIICGLPAMQRTGFKLLLEILVRAKVNRVQEIPFSFGERGGGSSKANFAVLRDYLLLLIRLYRARFEFSPRSGSHTPLSAYVPAEKPQEHNTYTER